MDLEEQRRKRVERYARRVEMRRKVEKRSEKELARDAQEVLGPI
jgi:hypothetical protein